MASVKLRVNLITQKGTFIKAGSVVDLEAVPARWPKKPYNLRKGEADPDAKRDDSREQELIDRAVEPDDTVRRRRLH
jgi:hypothetical protein